MADLLPCPFCGGPAHDAHAGGSAWFIGATHADGCFFADFQRSEAEAIAAWNTRHDHMADLVEALAPFAAIKPSSLYPDDGSEAEEYVVILKGGHGNPAEFTGADLARARAALSRARNTPDLTPKVKD